MFHLVLPVTCHSSSLAHLKIPRTFYQIIVFIWTKLISIFSFLGGAHFFEAKFYPNIMVVSKKRPNQRIYSLFPPGIEFHVVNKQWLIFPVTSKLFSVFSRRYYQMYNKDKKWKWFPLENISFYAYMYQWLITLCQFDSLWSHTVPKRPEFDLK